MSNVEPLPFDPIKEGRRRWEARGWVAAAPGAELIAALTRVQQIYLVRVERVLRPHGLSFARFEVLMVLLFAKKHTVPLGKLGARLQVQPGAVTNAINRLEATGFVERVPHPTDGRTTLARMTKEGKRVALRAAGDLNQQVYTDLPVDDEDCETLTAILRKIRLAEGDFSED